MTTTNIEIPEGIKTSIESHTDTIDQKAFTAEEVIESIQIVLRQLLSDHFSYKELVNCTSGVRDNFLQAYPYIEAILQMLLTRTYDALQAVSAIENEVSKLYEIALKKEAG